MLGVPSHLTRSMTATGYLDRMVLAPAAGRLPLTLELRGCLPGSLAYKRRFDAGTVRRLRPVVRSVCRTGSRTPWTRSSSRARANTISSCLLYTSDAADDLLCVDLG